MPLDPYKPDYVPEDATVVQITTVLGAWGALGITAAYRAATGKAVILRGRRINPASRVLSGGVALVSAASVAELGGTLAWRASRALRMRQHERRVARSGHGDWPLRAEQQREGVADLGNKVVDLIAALLLPPLGWLSAALDRGGRR